MCALCSSPKGPSVTEKKVGSSELELQNLDQINREAEEREERERVEREREERRLEEVRRATRQFHKAVCVTIFETHIYILDRQINTGPINLLSVRNTSVH